MVNVCVCVCVCMCVCVRVEGTAAAVLLSSPSPTLKGPPGHIITCVMWGVSMHACVYACMGLCVCLCVCVCLMRETFVSVFHGYVTIEKGSPAGGELDGKEREKEDEVWRESRGDKGQSSEVG